MNIIGIGRESVETKFMPACKMVENAKVDERVDFTKCKHYQDSKYTACMFLRWNWYCDEYFKYLPEKKEE